MVGVIPAPQRITADSIILAVSEYYKVSVSEIKSLKRNRNVSTARQIAMYLCKHLLSMPIYEIRIEFDKREEATVLHALQKIEMERKKNELMNKEIDELCKIITEAAMETSSDEFVCQ